MGSPGADQLICLPRMGYAGLGFGDRDPAVLVQADHTGPAASPLTIHLCTELPCAQPVAYVTIKGGHKALLGECFCSWSGGWCQKEGLWCRERTRTKASHDPEHPPGLAPLGWLSPAQKEPLVCRISCSTALGWTVREEKRARDSCKEMGKGRGYLA